MSASNENNGPPAPPQNPSHSNFNLLSIVTREKHTGPNHLDWIRSLRIGLRYEGKEYVLDNDLPELPEDPTETEVKAYEKHDEDSTKVACLMLSTMSSELQKSFENVGAFDINFQLQEMFQERTQYHGLVLLCYLAMHVGNSEALVKARVLTALEGADRSIVGQHSELEELVVQAIYHFNMYHAGVVHQRQAYSP